MLVLVNGGMERPQGQRRPSQVAVRAESVGRERLLVYSLRLSCCNIYPLSVRLLVSPTRTNMETPNEPIGFVPVKAGEVLNLASGIVCRIQEDGSRTSMSI